MPTIFISYDRMDVDYRNTIIHEIGRHGFKAWVDSDELRNGQEWQQPIDDEIRKAFALVVVMTPYSAESEYVTYEWIFGLGAGIPIIPVLFKPIPSSKMHPRMNSLTWVDFLKIPRPVQDLIDALHHAEQDYKPYTSRLITGLPPIVQRAVEQLHDLDPLNRKLALENLVNMKQIEPLASAMQHPARDVYENAALSFAELTNYQDRRAEPVLLKMLAAKSQETRVQSAIALGRLGSSAAEPLLIDMLRSRTVNERRTAITALASLRSVAALPHLRALLQEPENYVEESIAWAFGQIGDTSAVPDLLALLNSSSPSLAADAINSLGVLGAAEAVPEIAKYLSYVESANILETPDIAAINALRRIGDSRAIPFLVEALTENWRLTSRIVDALAFFEWEPTTTDERVDFYLATGAIAECAKLGQLVFDKVTHYVHSESVHMRSSAIKVLGALGDVRAIPVFETLYSEEEGNYWKTDIAEALGAIGDPQAMPLLTRMSRSPSWLVRRAAVEAAGKLESADALEIIKYALSDSEETVRRAAQVTLLSAGGDNAWSRETGIWMFSSLKDEHVDNPAIPIVDLKLGWEKFMKAVARQNRTLPGILDFYYITRISRDKIFLSTNIPAMYHRLAPFPEKMAILHKALAAAFRVPLQIELILEEN